jgi:uncharacterized protein (TIGR02217 family)
MFDNILLPLTPKSIKPTHRLQDTVAQLGGGSESRNAWWSQELKAWDVQFADVITLAQYQLLRNHYLARSQRVRSFPFFDYTDYLANADTFAVADGTAGPFQLKVSRGDSGNAYYRTVYKVIPGTETIFVNGSAKVRGTDYTIDNTTAKILFIAGHFPVSSAVLSWSGQFYIPARWDMTEGNFAELFMYVNNGQQLVQTQPAKFVETRDYQ